MHLHKVKHINLFSQILNTYFEEDDVLNAVHSSKQISTKTYFLRNKQNLQRRTKNRDCCEISMFQVSKGKLGFRKGKIREEERKFQLI